MLGMLFVTPMSFKSSTNIKLLLISHADCATSTEKAGKQYMSFKICKARSNAKNLRRLLQLVQTVRILQSNTSKRLQSISKKLGH